MDNPKIPQHTESLYDFTLTSASGDVISMEQYRGQVLLIVNTASQCGFTGQYTGMQSLHETYKARGLCVIAVPCNQFGAQEPGSAEEIRTFVNENYNIDFPMFSKIAVNGDGACDLYDWLRSEQPGEGDSSDITWNFEKFLVNAAGDVVARFAPTVTPEEVAEQLPALLG